MAVGFGIAQDDNGNGTTPEDVQRIWGAMFYNDGVMHGGQVTTTGTLHYNVASGAANIKTGRGMLVLVPIQETQVPAPQPPATGTARHTIYVQQRMPAIDGDNNVLVACTAGNAPANSVILDRFEIKAGAVSTNGAPSVYDRRYSRPVGSSLGRLSHATLQPGKAYKGRAQWGHQTFYVPHDANIEVRVPVSLSRTNDRAQTLNGNLRGFITHQIYIDGKLRNAFMHEIDGRPAQTRFFATPEWVSEGSHTLYVDTSVLSYETGVYVPNDFFASFQDYARGFHGTHCSVDHLGMRL